MKTKTILLAFSLILSIGLSTAQTSNLAPAGKKIYIPKEFQEDDFNNPESKYSYHRMAYTDDIVVFWEKGFGKDISKAPKLNNIDMTVDVPALLKATQRFYEYYRDTLHFITKGSLADKYRMMVMINYSEEGTAYGGSYDDVIGALWVTPLRLHDKKFNCIAHELGHSFQAQIGCDGVRSSGGGLWEYTSQWMLWHVNPYWMTDENYHWVAYMGKTNKSPFSFENMYCAPYLMEYWSNKHGLEIITKIWRESKEREDPISSYQRQTGITQEQFNDEVFDAAKRYMTYDIERIREVARPYANRHSYTLTPLTWGWYGNDYSRLLEDNGYSGTSLQVPEKGTVVSVRLKGKMPEKAKGEWKYALVPVKNETEPQYGKALEATTVNGEGETIEYKIADGITHLWLVVVSAPAENGANATWPYMVQIKGTKPAVVGK